MDLASVVLFAHVALVLTGMMLAAVMHAALFQLRASTQVAASRPWGPAIGRIEPLLPLVSILILASGIWLLALSDGEFAWTDGWVLTSIVALIFVEVAGAPIAPRSKRLRQALKDTPDGPVPSELHRMTLDPVIWCMAHGATAIFFGIVFLMVVKPVAGWSVVVVVVAALLGLASAMPFLRDTQPA